MASREKANLGSPEQAELPAIPPAPPPTPPKPAPADELYESLEWNRKDQLEQLGVPFVSDEKRDRAYIRTALKPIIEACAAAEVEPESLFEDFLADPWAAKMTPIPFSLSGFFSPKMWRDKYLKTILDRREKA